MIIKIDNQKGIKLKTQDKYCKEDIEVLPMLQDKRVIYNGDYQPDEGYMGFNSVKVAVAVEKDDIPGEGEYWVKFVDFRGEIISERWANNGEFIAFPTPPEIEGFTFDGWTSNMPLEEGGITVKDNNVYCGALYVTSDGKTRVHINITDEQMLTVGLCFYQSIASGIEVDFGDGSESYIGTSSGRQNIEHTYPAVGEYVITFTIAEDATGYLGGNSTTYGVMGRVDTANADYQKLVTKIEYGKRISASSVCVCTQCVNLEQVNLTSTMYIEKSGFIDCHKLKCLLIPLSSRTYTADDLCSNCYSLEHLVIPYNVTTIRQNLANNCMNLKKIALPYAVEVIENYAFNCCDKLNDLVMPDSLKVIENYVFYSNKKLCALKWSKNLEEIGDQAFSYCSTLKGVDFYDSLISIGSNAFSYCLDITEIVMPDSVTTVGTYALANMPNLKKVVFSKNLLTVGEYCLRDCFNIVDLTMPERLVDFTHFIENQYRLKRVVVPPKVSNISEKFSGLRYAECVDFRQVEEVPTLVNNSFFSNLTNSDMKFWVGGDKIYKFKNKDVWNTSTILNRLVCKQTGVENLGTKAILINENHLISLSYGVEGDQTPEFSVTSSNESAVVINSFTAEDNHLDINLTSNSSAGESNLVITMTVGDQTYVESMKIAVLESAPEYAIEVVDVGAEYGFALDSEGYYASGNYGIGSSVALSKIVFTSDYLNFYNLSAYCDHSAQKYYDYGTISKLNMALTSKNAIDKSLSYAKCFREVGVGTATIDYGTLKNSGDFVYLKYIKNMSINSYSDTFKVKFNFVRDTSTLITE